MASSDRQAKDISKLNAPSGDDLVEGILAGVDDYKAGRIKNFKNKEDLLSHLNSL